MKPIRGMLKHIRRHPVFWSAGLILPPFAALATNLAFAYGLEAYTAELLNPGAIFGRIVSIMLVTLASLVLSTMVEDAARYVFAAFAIKTENDIRQGLFSGLVWAKYRELGKLDRGELLTRYNADAGTATNLIAWDLFSVLWPVVLGTGYLASLFAANPVVGAVMLTLAVTVILLNAFFMKRFAALEKSALACRDGYTGSVAGAVRGKMSIRLLSAGGTVANGINQEARRVYDNENAKVKLSAVRAATLEFLATVCGSLTAPLACVLAALGMMPAASVVLIAQLCRYLILYTNGFGTAMTNFNLHAVSYARLRALSGIPGERDAGTDKAYQRRDTDTVLEFSDVGIAYDGSEVLNHATFSIRRGEIAVLLGASGSGKSSVVKALMRLIDYSGEIRLLGGNIDALPIRELRESMAYVPEQSELFDATVSENLLYAAPAACPERLKKALRDAALFDSDMPAREAGGCGGKLSGGQRQRVAIARALLKDAPLYILDEPTASLDAESESLVLRTFEDLKRQGKSLLIITHRESTMKIADKVMMIDEGRIISRPLTNL